MKKYIAPSVDQVDFQMNGTLCSSVQPSAAPENNGRPTPAGAPAHKPF